MFNGSDEATPEFKFMTHFDLRDSVVYDVGAFQGIMTLFFSKQAKHVVAYEANPETFVRLRENVELNNLTRVTLRNLALSDAEGSIELRFDALMPGAASGDQGVGSQIAALSHRLRTVRVPAVTLDDDINRNRLPAPDFIKIDIEGAELSALRGMKRTLATYAPRIYMESHGATFDEKERKVATIVEFLNEHGYEDILHIESVSRITSRNSSVAREGHLYCTRG